ncbi:MAG: rubrerythrin family protein [Defluviitaleaceae bacterium]|nr:rubrerythrin family protein [Defluviitaleaceae bacterium]
MSEKLKGTKTESNLRAAFSGESQARNRYSYFADTAKQEGYDEIAKFFEDTATNERTHAKVWYKLLRDNLLPDTKQNLRDAIEGERFERAEMYPAFAKTAKEEGFDDIAHLFEEIARIEKKHEDQCKIILESLETNNAINFIAPDITCLQCGHDFTEDKNYTNCPICNASSAFFIKKQN